MLQISFEEDGTGTSQDVDSPILLIKASDPCSLSRGQNSDHLSNSMNEYSLCIFVLENLARVASSTSGLIYPGSMTSSSTPSASGLRSTTGTKLLKTTTSDLEAASPGLGKYKLLVLHVVKYCRNSLYNFIQIYCCYYITPYSSNLKLYCHIIQTKLL